MLLAGRVEESETWAAEFLELGLRGGFGNEVRFYHAWMMLDIRRHQDRVGELEGYFTKAAAELERLPYLRAVLALLYCDSGKTTEAEKLLTDAATGDFAGPPVRPDVALRDGELCRGVGPPPTRSERLPGSTSGWRRFHYQVAFAWWATGGAVAFYLGMLSTTLGRCDDAEAHFAEALAIHERLRAPYWTARTHLETARMLLTRRSPGTPEGQRRYSPRSTPSPRSSPSPSSAVTPPNCPTSGPAEVEPRNAVNEPRSRPTHRDRRKPRRSTADGHAQRRRSHNGPLRSVPGATSVRLVVAEGVLEVTGGASASEAIQGEVE